MALPVSLDEAKAQLRILDDEQDIEIEGFIRDAASWVEDYTGHILEPRAATEQFDQRGPVHLKAWPIADGQPVLVDHEAPDGTVTSIAGAKIRTERRPAFVFGSNGTLWPFPANAGTRFSVTVEAGYDDPQDVPRNLRRAMLVLIGGYDADREGGEVFQAAEKTAMSLCRHFKYRKL
ncbi:MAG: head-tail connector protein [Pontixanthobacter sp.]